MVNYYLVLLAIFIHWFADFVLQTDKMAQNKSTSFKWLSSHVGVYTLCFIGFGPLVMIINGVTHLITDAITSRITSYLWKKGDRHNFFVVIGFDQFIHVAILIYSLQFMGWDYGSV